MRPSLIKKYIISLLISIMSFSSIGKDCKVTTKDLSNIDKALNIVRNCFNEKNGSIECRKYLCASYMGSSFQPERTEINFCNKFENKVLECKKEYSEKNFKYVELLFFNYIFGSFSAKNKSLLDRLQCHSFVKNEKTGLGVYGQKHVVYRLRDEELSSEYWAGIEFFYSKGKLNLNSSTLPFCLYYNMASDEKEKY